MPIEILYQDAWLVAVHKPPGMLVHRTAEARDRGPFLLQEVRDLLGRRVWPVHRLDRATSGLILFALDAETAAVLGRDFRNGRIAKSYVALVRGQPACWGVIDHPLRPTRRGPGPGRPARTRFRTLGLCELPWPVPPHPAARYGLVALHPETGRRHQLRRHLKHVSHPVVGDTTYGDGRHNRIFRDRLSLSGLMLASTGLDLEHPRAGGVLHLRAPLRRDFSALVETLLPDLDPAFPARSPTRCPQSRIYRPVLSGRWQGVAAPGLCFDREPGNGTGCAGAQPDGPAS